MDAQQFRRAVQPLKEMADNHARVSKNMRYISMILFKPGEGDIDQAIDFLCATKKDMLNDAALLGEIESALRTHKKIL